MAISDRARDFWDRISPRERMLVVVLAIGVPVALAVWLGLSIRDGLIEREARNEQTREALDVIAKLREKGPQAAPVDEVPIPDDPIPLETYVTKAAEKNQLKFKGSIETRKGTPKNGFVTTTVTCSLDDITTDQLKAFLAEVEGPNKTVVVTHLDIRRDFRDKKKLDANFEISTYSKHRANAAGSAEAEKKDS
jgi:hypothetical protein